MAELDIDKGSTFNQTSPTEADCTLDKRSESAGDFIQGDDQSERIDLHKHPTGSDTVLINKRDSSASKKDSDASDCVNQDPDSEVNPGTQVSSSSDKTGSRNNEADSTTDTLKSDPPSNEGGQTDGSIINDNIDNNVKQSDQPKKDKENGANKDANLDSVQQPIAIPRADVAGDAEIKASEKDPGDEVKNDDSINDNQQNADDVDEDYPDDFHDIDESEQPAESAKLEAENETVAGDIEAEATVTESSEETRENKDLVVPNSKSDDQRGTSEETGALKGQSEETDAQQVKSEETDAQEVKSEETAAAERSDDETKKNTEETIDQHLNKDDVNETRVIKEQNQDTQDNNDDSSGKSETKLQTKSGSDIDSKPTKQEEIDKPKASTDQGNIPATENKTITDKSDNVFNVNPGDNLESQDVVNSEESDDKTATGDTETSKQSKDIVKITSGDNLESKDAEKSDDKADTEGTVTAEDSGDVGKSEETTENWNSDLERRPAERAKSPALSHSLCSERQEEVLTTVVIDENGIPQVTVTTVPDRPPSSQASETDIEERTKQTVDSTQDVVKDEDTADNDNTGDISDTPLETKNRDTEDSSDKSDTLLETNNRDTDNSGDKSDTSLETNNRDTDNSGDKSDTPLETNNRDTDNSAVTEPNSPGVTKDSTNLDTMESRLTDNASDTQVHSDSQDREQSNIDQRGDHMETAESSNMKADNDSDSGVSGSDKVGNKSVDGLNNTDMTDMTGNSDESAHLANNSDGERMQGQNGANTQDVSEDSKDTVQGTPANQSRGKMDKQETQEVNSDQNTEAGDGECKDDTKVEAKEEEKVKKEEKVEEEPKVISPLEQILQRNVTIDGNVEVFNELETNAVKLLKSMTEVMKHYNEQLKLQSLKDFTEDLGKFRGDFESVNDAFKRCSSMSGHINTCLKELKITTEDVKMQINRKFQNEDLNTWIDQSPEEEKAKEKLQEESIAEEKVALARATEARHAVATAAVGIAEAQKLVSEMEVQHAEADATSKKATAQAKAALVAAEEARVAAAERKRAEDAAKQRADERARQKAEEEKKKRQEEEVQIVQEANRKGVDVEDERERYMREKAQKEAERRNPKNWPKYSFNVTGKDFNPSVGCIIRAIDGSMRGYDVEVTFVDQANGELTLKDNEELGSNVINIKQVDAEKKFIFEEPLSVALPVCYSRLAMGRDVVVKQQLASGQWKELPTSEVQFEDFRELKFVEGRCRGFGKFVVVLRLKKESVKFIPRGNKVTSSVDSRITFSSKQGCFRHLSSAVIEVQPLDVNTISDLKTRAPAECDHLLTSSPFIRMSIPVKKFPKPMTITLPLPQAQTKQKRPATSVGRRTEGTEVRPQTARPSNTSDDEPTDDVHLLYKDDKTGWTKNSKVKLIQPNNKDVVVFDFTEPCERFVLLRTKTGLRDSAVEKMAGLMDKSLNERNVKVMLRQRSDDAADVMVSCSSSTRLDRIIRNCDEEGYTEGPAPSPDLVLREGEQLYMKFRGNIHCVSENPSLDFIFNSHVQTTRKFFVDELDIFAQKSLPCYRGFVQVYTKRMVPRPPAEGAPKNAPPTMVEAEVLLAELLVELPKPEAEPPKPLKTAPMPMKEGPLTSSVLHHVARELGKEWKEVAGQLNLKPMRIQAILRQNVNKDTPQTRYDMLVTWAKRVPKAGDKVQILCVALQSCGRGDLAEEIRYRGDEFKQQRLMSARVSHLRQAFVKVAKTVTICNRWQTFAKNIGVPEDEIEKIEAGGGSGQEKCYSSLETWKTVAGEKATVTELATHLKTIKQERLSRDVESVLAT